jgi:protein required for attachment to host cells
MLIAHGTLVAVIDGAHFALLRNGGSEAEPVLEAHALPALNLHAIASGGQHGRMAGHDPANQVIEGQHSSAVAAWLNHEVLAHRINDLIIVASPRTLGELRPHYHSELKRVLRREFAKELVGKTGAEVLAALRG